MLQVISCRWKRHKRSSHPGKEDKRNKIWQMLVMVLSVHWRAFKWQVRVCSGFRDRRGTEGRIRMVGEPSRRDLWETVENCVFKFIYFIPLCLNLQVFSQYFGKLFLLFLAIFSPNYSFPHFIWFLLLVELCYSSFFLGSAHALPCSDWALEFMQ